MNMAVLPIGGAFTLWKRSQTLAARLLISFVISIELAFQPPVFVLTKREDVIKNKHNCTHTEENRKQVAKHI